MQSETGSKKYVRAPNTHWYKSRKLTVSLFAFTSMTWLLSAPYLLGQLNSTPTLVIFKSDGCAYLHHQKIATQSYGIEGVCTISAPFRANLIGSGGVIEQGDRHIKIADNQIIAVEEIENSPLSPKQENILIGLCIFAAFLIGTMILAFVSLF